MHQRISLVAIKKMDAFEGVAQLVEQALLVGKGSHLRTGGRWVDLAQLGTAQFVECDRYRLSQVQGWSGRLGGNVQEPVAAGDLVVGQPTRFRTEGTFAPTS